MRRIVLYGMIVIIFLNLCGCQKDDAGIKGVVFDVENQQLTTDIAADSTLCTVAPYYATYSRVMKWIGEDGIIAAGYATGLRASVYSRQGSYTKTSFVVTDVYKGALKPSTIEIRENYAVLEENGERYYISTIDDPGLAIPNDVRILVFLKPTEDGQYWLCYRFVPLMDDYKDYNETYLTSVLNFFRGDRSQYIAEGTWSESHISTATGEKVTLSHHLAFWPKQEISDKDLLAEMNNHLLIRLATDYKIAIWPYGHKNFRLNRYADWEFVRICIPVEEKSLNPYFSDEFFGIKAEESAVIMDQ